MKKSRVSMSDIAEKLGISKYAVSLALSNKKGVSEKTRELVVRTCEEMGYDLERIKVKGDGEGMIGVITPDYFLRDPHFFSDLLGSIEKEIRARGYSLILGAIDEEDIKTGHLPDLLTKNRLDGIIVISDIGSKLFYNLIKTGIPKVVVDHYNASMGIDSIMTDNFNGAYNAAMLLGRSGLHKIGFIGNIYSAVSYQERWEGFRRALNELKLNLDLKTCYLGEGSKFVEGHENNKIHYLNGIKGFIDGLEELPEAFFCANNPATTILYNALTTRRLSIPDEISVVGFDDSEIMKMSEPPVTMVHIHKEFYGQRAVEQLFYNMKHPGKPKEVIRIATELFERKSVKESVGGNLE